MLREFIEQLDKLPQKAMVNCLEINPSKPLIGIISAQNDVSFAQKNLDAVCERVKEGIVANGAAAKIPRISRLKS